MPIVDIFVYENKSSSTIQVWKSFFSQYIPDWNLRLCFADEILRTDATHVLFPGGSGSKFYKKLGPENSSRVIDWVTNGGSYIGVCAGAYLASSHLKITPLTIPDKAWQRGLHETQIDLISPIGTGIYEVNYHNGPIFENSESVEVWGRFKSNFLAEGGTFPMENSPAIAHHSFHKGIVTLFSPHLEKSSDEVKKQLAKTFEYIDYKIHNRNS